MLWRATAMRRASPHFWGLRLVLTIRLILEREDGGPGGDGSAGAVVAKAARGIAGWGCLATKSGPRRTHAVPPRPCVARERL
jgi:hypothetical protein